MNTVLLVIDGGPSLELKNGFIEPNATYNAILRGFTENSICHYGAYRATTHKHFDSITPAISNYLVY